MSSSARDYESAMEYEAVGRFNSRRPINPDKNDLKEKVWTTCTEWPCKQFSLLVIGTLTSTASMISLTPSVTQQ